MSYCFNGQLGTPALHTISFMKFYIADCVTHLFKDIQHILINSYISVRNILEGKASGVCPRCVPQVCASGVCPRCVPQVCAPGVFPRCVPQVCAPGVCLRCVPQVYASGVCLRCMPQVYAPGVCLHQSAVLQPDYTS